MDNPDQERRDSLRKHGWTEDPRASVWISESGQSVKAFLPDGTEVETGNVKRGGYTLSVPE